MPDGAKPSSCQLRLLAGSVATSANVEHPSPEHRSTRYPVSSVAASFQVSSACVLESASVARPVGAAGGVSATTATLFRSTSDRPDEFTPRT